MSTESAVRERIIELGADLVGFAEPTLPSSYADRFSSWIDDGMHADMGYLAKRSAAGVDCNDLLSGTKTVIVMAFNYHYPTVDRPQTASVGRISKYATIRDYHKSVGSILKKCSTFLADEYNVRNRGFVDASPLMERAYAETVGMGFVGKSGMMITKEFGSSVFLATVLTTLELVPDGPMVKRACGDCRACQSACPTGAICGDGRVDSRKCISYLTIENRNDIAKELRKSVGNSVFGCDRCQTACPFNSKPRPARLEEFTPRIDGSVPIEDILSITDHEMLVDRYAGLPIMRAKWDGLLRNACVAAGNSGDLQLEARLVKIVESTPSEMVRTHAEWALERLKQQRS
jgi:epoxyqueuosine reductase